MKLVIVETPAQAKVLTDVLGEGWHVEPCYCPVRDLRDGELGIDITDDFRPTFVVVPGQGNLVRRLMKAMRESEAVYVATPPGRAGEIMAWHVLALSPDAKDRPIYRVSLSALTPEAIRAAVAAPRPLNQHWIDAELAMQLVDRLAGYAINTAARQRGEHRAISRTAMIALCQIAALENVLGVDASAERWQVSVRLLLDGTEVTATATLHHPSSAPVTFSSRQRAEAAAYGLQAARYWVAKTGLREEERPAPVPYTLSTLLVDAEQKLGIAPDAALALIGVLYDASWITHPLEQLPHSLVKAARTYARREYGTDYGDSEPAVLRNGIAPANVSRVPEALPGDGAALYGLIWRRFMASLLPPARLRQSSVQVLSGVNRARPYPLHLRAVGTLVAFDGWLHVLPDEQPGTEGYLPTLREGDEALFAGADITPVNARASQRFTLASLIDTYGSSHPAAWVAALDELEAADYLIPDGGKLVVTDAGAALAAWAAARFPSVVSESAVAELERDLEHVAAGERGRVEVVRAFWERLVGDVRSAATPARTVWEHKPVVLRPAEEV